MNNDNQNNNDTPVQPTVGTPSNTQASTTTGAQFDPQTGERLTNTTADASSVQRFTQSGSQGPTGNGGNGGGPTGPTGTGAGPQMDDQGPKRHKQHRGRQLVLIAAVAALVGGGVGGAAAYYGFSRTQGESLGVTDSSGTSGTTKVSNVSVKESSSATKAYAKVKAAVVSVINMQYASSSSNSSSSDWSEYFGNGGSDSGQSDGSSSNGSNSSGSSSSGTLEAESEGSGVIYEKKDGKAYIVTNNHVVSGEDKLQVILSDGTKLTAKLVGKDSTSDLAVLSVDGSKISTVASFGDSSDLQAGQTVLAIGSPLGSSYASSVTEGIISATKRTVDTDEDSAGGSTTKETVIQTDAAINSGNSGGALINLAGQVIGINSMKLSGETSSGATIEGMGFAIPSNEVVSIINQLVTKGKVTRPALGVEVENLSAISTTEQTKTLKLPSTVSNGVVIAGFTSGSNAQSAGLKKYDVITKIGSTKITDIADLRSALYKYSVGDTVKITFYRSGKLQTINMKLSQTQSELSSSSSSSSSSSK